MVQFPADVSVSRENKGIQLTPRASAQSDKQPFVTEVCKEVDVECDNARARRKLFYDEEFLFTCNLWLQLEIVQALWALVNILLKRRRMQDGTNSRFLPPDNTHRYSENQ